jgi:N,N'-diacetyllegionaminate synthase
MSFSGKHGPLLIAEIGGNHEGDFLYANDLLDLALDSQADAIKFQIYFPDTLVNKSESPDRWEHFKKFTFSPMQHIELAEKCKAGGKEYLASVWDIDALDWIDPYLSYYKIGSGDLTAYPILEKVVEKGKPIILSTGLSTFSEVEESVRFIQGLDHRYEDRNMLAVLQCSSMYPIPEVEANLNVIGTLGRELNISVGYSDHTEDMEALYLAAVVGADVLEFHFTDTKQGKTFRDHKVSLTKDDVSQLVGRIRRAHEIFGSGVKEPTASELENKHPISFRRAIYPVRDIIKGEVMRDVDLTALRPNRGVDARYTYRIIGKRAKKNIGLLDVLDEDMFE